jgi:ABC-2 type transport system permease protein
MKKILGLLKRAIFDEWMHVLREKTLLMVLAAIPVVYPVIISSLYMNNQPVDRPALLIDADNSQLSRELVRKIDATQEVRIAGKMDSLEEAWDRLLKPGAELLLYVPEDFSRRIKKGEQAEIKLWIPTANMLAYGTSYVGVNSALASVNEGLSRKYFFGKGMTTSIARQRIMPITRDMRQLFHPTMAYGGFLVTGVFVIIVQQLVLLAMSVSFGLRTEKGEVIRGAPCLFPTLAGRFLGQMAFYAAGIAAIYFIVYPIFGWPARSLCGLYLLTMFFVLTISPLAIAVAYFTPDKYFAFQMLMFLSTPVFMMSGFPWPLAQMPLYIRALSVFLAPTPTLAALRIFSLKTASLTLALPYLGWMAGLFILYALIAYALIARDAKLLQIKK